MQKLPKDAWMGLFLLLIPWAYMFEYLIQPPIEDWLGEKMGVTFILVKKRIGRKVDFVTVIKERLGFWEKHKIWFFHTLLVMPAFALWMGLAAGAIYLFAKLILKV